ncbi:MAG: hypothetical protein KGI66_04475, partial [Patescibacteria group bacterium]|nr:hypothetical protein [Patescibacteria group bacterium]
MMRTLKRSLIFLAITIAGFLLPGLSGFAAGLRFVPMANAETKIGGRISSQSWTKENSPYKLTADVFIPANETLNIGPGAVVEPDDSDPNASIILDPGANLYIDGQPDDRAVIGRLGHIYALQGNVRISYADMSTQGIDLQLYSSTADISSSTFIRSTGTAIYVSQSRVAIRDSRIEDNQYAGVIALPSKMSSYIDIHDSIIARNGIGIQNSGGSTVHAENVWWGDPSGPALTGQNRVIGSVAYSPWLAAEPPLAFDPPKPVCCSNVLFIPGIEGSRLYNDQSAFGVATATMKMWEPATDLSLASLRMNADGSSADPAIYSGDPLGSAYGLKDIYGGFMASLGSLVERGIINEWRPFGYDWRRPIADIVSGPEKKATTTESLIGIVEQMAAASKTGKVSIVAHSNGGLVAKALVKALADAGRSSLIDTVVSVAVPYLGTPQAIAALLHGDSQAILGGLLMSQKAARDLSQNMASAYSLLPSAAYFAQAVSPSIAFASTSIEGLGNEAYPAKIADAADQSGFIADSAGTRAQPSYSEVDRPTKGNSLLLNAANALHAALDAFVWPASISRWAVVGWDQPTTKAVQYFQGLSCSIKLFRPWCAPAVKYETKKTLGGDGVVVSASASHDAGQGISVDLSAVSGQEGRYVDHVSMLGASTTQGVIARILSAPSSSGDKVRADLSGLPGVSITGPSVLPSPEYLVVKTHSPVELHVYDDMGRHTGFISKPAALDGNSSIAAAYE